MSSLSGKHQLQNYDIREKCGISFNVCKVKQFKLMNCSSFIKEFQQGLRKCVKGDNYKTSCTTFVTSCTFEHRRVYL